MRLIDADALMKECYEELEDDSLWHDEGTSKDYADGHDEGMRMIMAIIDQSSTIDTVEVVRCKDCKYYNAIDTDRLSECEKGFETCGNDYCSYGERK